MAVDDIVLYHYYMSPYAQRVAWYLTLRGIPYNQCLQPPVMPRPDVSRLGIAHRRIPLLSIGRDVYLDTRLQIQKLEAMHPSLPRLGASDADLQAIERLISILVIESGVFNAAVALLPSTLPALKDPKFNKDRAEFMGVVPTREERKHNVSEALVKVASVFSLFETTLLADGREWISKTEGPSLADIEAIWPLSWVAGIPGALPADQFSAEKYPKVYAWMARFRAALKAATKKMGKPRTITGEEAANLITGSPFHEEEVRFDAEDPVVTAQGLKKGDVVTIWPTDTGMAHKDAGRLLGIDANETVFETAVNVRVHAPRVGFRVQKGNVTPAGKL